MGRHNEASVEMDEQMIEKDESNAKTRNCVISDAPLHVLVPSLEVNQAIRHKIRRIETRYRITVNSGRFSADEDCVLTRNWNRFCDAFGVNEEMKLHLLGYFSREGINYSKRLGKDIKTLRKKENFMLRLAFGLPNRTLQSIYNRARHLFCDLKRTKDINEEEINRFVDMRYKHRLKYMNIAEITRCHPKDVIHILMENFNNNGFLYKKGVWNHSEDRRLLKALKKFLNTNDLNNKIFAKNIKWNRVQELSRVNRSALGCNMRWRQSLRWKLIESDKNKCDKWKRKYNALLVYVLFRCDYDNEYDIDWDFIKEKFAQKASFNTVCKNWRILKSTVPDLESKSYKQIINYLYDNLLPKFVKTDDDLRRLELFLSP